MESIDIECAVCENAMHIGSELLQRVSGRLGRVTCSECSSRIYLDMREGVARVKGGRLLRPSQIPLAPSRRPQQLRPDVSHLSLLPPPQVSADYEQMDAPPPPMEVYTSVQANPPEAKPRLSTTAHGFTHWDLDEEPPSSRREFHSLSPLTVGDDDAAAESRFRAAHPPSSVPPAPHPSPRLDSDPSALLAEPAPFSSTEPIHLDADGVLRNSSDFLMMVPKGSRRRHLWGAHGAWLAAAAVALVMSGWAAAEWNAGERAKGSLTAWFESSEQAAAAPTVQLAALANSVLQDQSPPLAASIPAALPKGGALPFAVPPEDDAVGAPAEDERPASSEPTKSTPANKAPPQKATKKATPRTTVAPVVTASPESPAPLGSTDAGEGAASEPEATGEPSDTTAEESDELGAEEPEAEPTKEELAALLPEDIQPTQAPFNRSAAATIMSGIASGAHTCRKEGGPTGVARVSVTFATSGRVTRAVVVGPPFAGTVVGGCIASRFRSANVPPFAGEMVTVMKTVAIR